MVKYILTLMTISLLGTANFAQSVIDLSKNQVGDRHIQIAGTSASIDTTGLGLQATADPKAFMDEKTLSFFTIEQKQVAIKDYEPFVNKMLQLDSTIFESKVVLNELTGRMRIGIIAEEQKDKEFWFCYVGNQDFVVEVKGLYDVELNETYSASFQKVINSLFVDVDRKISIYEDLPFFLDEEAFPFQKEFSMRPQSITVSQQIGEERRSITMIYSDLTEQEIEERKKAYANDTEKEQVGDKEVFIRAEQVEDDLPFEAIVVRGTQLVYITSLISAEDKQAIADLKEVVRSIMFK